MPPGITALTPLAVEVLIASGLGRLRQRPRTTILGEVSLLGLKQRKQCYSVEESSDGSGDSKRQKKHTECSVLFLGPRLNDHVLEMQRVFCIEDLTPLNASQDLKMPNSCLFNVLGAPGMVPRIRVSKLLEKRIEQSTKHTCGIDLHFACNANWMHAILTC